MAGKLFHPVLNDIPLPVRFAISGIVGNGIFMLVYNLSLQSFQQFAGAGTIFAIVQFGCIILNHFLNVGIVFGWPKDYLTSLLSNMPVGLSALVLGALTTSTLDLIDFDYKVNSVFGLIEEETQNEEEKSGFWGSIVAMAVTGIFSYVALNVVNKSSSSDVGKKKEL